MTRKTIFRFGVAVVVLGLMAWLWPTFHLTVIDVLLLAIVLALVDLLMEKVLGRTFSGQYPGFLGWLSAVGILYVAHWVVPGMQMDPLAALTAGTVLWAIAHWVPAVFG